MHNKAIYLLLISEDYCSEVDLKETVYKVSIIKSNNLRMKVKINYMNFFSGFPHKRNTNAYLFLFSKIFKRLVIFYL